MEASDKLNSSQKISICANDDHQDSLFLLISKNRELFGILLWCQSLMTFGLQMLHLLEELELQFL